MDGQDERLNMAAPAASEDGREVVLRYAAEAPEVTLRFVAPEPLPGARRRTVQRLLEAAGRDDAAAEPEDEEEEEKRIRRWPWFLLGLATAPLLLCIATAVLFWSGRLSPEIPVDRYFNREPRGYVESGSEDSPATIERAANTDAVRLRVTEGHGEALNIRELYERVNPSTVTVAVSVSDTRMTVGTGVIFTEDGYILTNAHVLAGGSECFVVLSTGINFSAKLVGMDADKDLAVIKINGRGLPVAEFGDSDALCVGDPVYAIGNPLGLELRGTLTDGIVSAINRDVLVDDVVMTLIQTNAALNNGNSGGPLINAYGQVVGINTMKMGSKSSVSVEGLGFAIPISSSAYMVNDLIAFGEVRGEPVIGISVRTESVLLADGQRALEIMEVAPGSAADTAGIQIGDMLLLADGETVETSNDLLRIRRRYALGDTLRLTVLRAGEQLEFAVVLSDIS